MEPLTLAELRAAAEVIADQVVRTPVVTCDELDDLVGATVLCKVEGLQRAGSFKFRGAFHRLSKIPIAQRSAGVVAVSSGNHGAAVATAARMLDMSAVVFIPRDAPVAKRRLIEAAGAEVVTFDRSSDDREALAMARVEATGATFVHPFEDRDVMAGQGTAALEFHDQVGDLDLLLVPMSGGGLMAGCASAMAALSPRCRMIGVEPSLGDDTRRSFRAGRPVTIEQPATVADGLAVTSPGANTFAINHRLVERIETVTEEQIAAAMVTLRRSTGLLVEPSGAVGIAALLTGSPRSGATGSGFGGSGLGGSGPTRLRIGVILSGGNIDDERFEEIAVLAGDGAT